MSKLKPSVSSKPPSRKTPFQPAHAIQYGLALAMTDTHGLVSSVRCQFDFSIFKWELNDRRTALTSLPLEGIFQAKQFDQLNKL
ncbi:hypothetical protein PHMEG_00010883 [Phytophthora megakarya]|uniref:Uncharacterized protein n=1 Tax=Phytophthora megakarya TaxID=4795 RepID=A0A225WCW4_9STRA|nr:hypothetical protein PHMEG_00010883 [Phytophthora megakarya]